MNTYLIAETDFRLLFVQRYSSLPYWRLYVTNTGGVPVRDVRGRTRGFFRSGLPDGWPDITGYLIGSGRMIAFELKNVTTPHTEIQKAMAAFMTRAGVAVALYRCSEEISVEENLTSALTVLREACGV